MIGREMRVTLGGVSSQLQALKRSFACLSDGFRAAAARTI